MSGEQEIGNLRFENRNSKFENCPGQTEGPVSNSQFQIFNFKFPISNFQFPVSNFHFRVSRWLASAVALLATFASATLTYAQGCALCYNTASAAKAAGIAALRQGILILLIPPLAICLGVMVVGYRSRDHYNDPSELETHEQLELGSGLEHGELAATEKSENRSQKAEVGIQESVAKR